MQKIVKASSLSVVLVAMMLFFTGCSKTSVTNDSFEALANEKGLIIVDATEQFADYDFIEKVTLAVSDDNSYQFEFYVFSDESYAQNFFNENKGTFEQAATGNFKANSLSGKNYSKYTVTNDNEYMFLEYIDGTALYIHVNKTYKNEAKDFIKGLGY